MSDINYLSGRGRTEKSEPARLVSSVCCKHPNFEPSGKKGICDGSENRPSVVQDQMSSSQGRTATRRDLQL